MSFDKRMNSMDHANGFGVPSRDAIVLVRTDFPFRFSLSCVEKIGEQLGKRLGMVCVVVDLCGEDQRTLLDDETVVERLKQILASDHLRQTDRIVWLPFGLSRLKQEWIREAVLWQSAVNHAQCFAADSLSLRDWSDWVCASACESDTSDHAMFGKSCVHIHFVSEAGRPSLVGEELAVLTHWASQHGNGIDADYLLMRNGTAWKDVATSLQDSLGDRRFVIVPWKCRFESWMTAESNAEPISIFEDEIRPLRLDAAGGVGSGLALKFLSALDHGPIPIDVSPSLNTQTAIGLMSLRDAMNENLPSEYRNGSNDVSPRSMGSASLVYDDQGKVAWDRIWTSFCDLAMAGGPPHRGKLLEAVTAEEVRSDRDKYDQVVAEIERGIQLAASVPTVASPYLGWVGVQCESEAMAGWLVRAIIVENIMVRREGAVLYLPAGPKFRIEKEVKNVITSVAKTVHYWRAHLISKR